MRVIGHRGLPHAHPENSLAGLRAAVAMGADGVEFDVRTTSYGEQVLMHDATLDRTTDRKGPLSALGRADMASARLSNGEGIPTLSEALEACADASEIHVDVKDAESGLASCSAVFKTGMQDRTIFASSCGPWLVAVKMKYPKARVAFSCGERGLDSARIANSLKAEAVNLSLWAATRRNFGRARENGLRVYVWTVDRPRHLRKCLRMGADGIFTNRLDAVLPLLRAPE